MFYPIVIHQEGESSYGVTVPDLPGCFSAGDTLDEALDNVKEVISFHIETLNEDCEPIPEGTNIQDHESNPDFSGGLWYMIEA